MQCNLFARLGLAAALGAALLAGRPLAAQTADEAAAFIAETERELSELNLRANQAAWVAANFITVDTEALSAEAQKNLAVAIQRRALAARRFDSLQLPAEQRRKLNVLKLSLTAPPPGNPDEAAELTRTQVSMEADYGRGQYCRAGGECLDIGGVSRILATSRDPAELLDAWQGWHRVGAPMRERYTRFVELSNKGARELGHPNTGAMWRSQYEMDPDAFAAETDRLWAQVRPLYESLHAYVRARLVQQYGPGVVDPDGMIPAHLLGNMWAQEWGNIYPLVAPQNAAGAGFDLTELIRARNLDAKAMTRFGEGFFTSLGFDKLPETFWERSLFLQPKDRNVVCHASAWDLDYVDDLRIKMC
ncbi:MAG TPA: M2 family metallopeptidase, partial [Longimicrobium sp.]